VNPSASPSLRLPLWMGALLGLAILKFGNPVILEQEIGIPGSFSEWIARSRPWPTRIGLLLFALLAPIILLQPGTLNRLKNLPVPRWILIAGLGWVGWQCLSASTTVDSALTRLTLPHLLSGATCFLLGCLFARQNWKLILPGLGVGAILCWLLAVNQFTAEFRVAREMLINGQQTGWTNVSPSELQTLRENRLVIQTNGVDIANPVILDKLTRARVHGTLVYPNALAGLVLLAFPALLAGAWIASKPLRPVVRLPVLGLLTFLALASLYWSGSRSGWLIAVVMATVCAVRIPALHRYRWPIAAILGVAGLGFFAIRNQGYLEKGATSVSARLDYWQAAVINTREHPLLGSGPGTFMRPYARLKAPEAEMARLVHNDFLQQFTDSGLPGGVLYLVWIGGTLWWVWRCHHRSHDPLVWGLLVGSSGWLAQGLSEFSLYVPALAWTGFIFLGILAGLPGENPSTAPSRPRHLTAAP